MLRPIHKPTVTFNSRPRYLWQFNRLRRHVHCIIKLTNTPTLITYWFRGYIYLIEEWYNVSFLFLLVCITRDTTVNNDCVGRDSSVSIAIHYGLDVPGIEFRYSRHFRTLSDRTWDPPSLLYNEYRASFPEVKRPGCGVDHPPASSAEVKERVGILLLPFLAFMFYSRVNFYRGSVVWNICEILFFRSSHIYDSSLWMERTVAWPLK